MAEHLHCRAGAALFDVSHMGQAELVGEGAAAALEALTPADLQGLKPGRQRYGLLTTMPGGIFDDFMVANLGDRLFLVVNASRKEEDFALVEAALPSGVRLRRLPDRALIALQGPKAAEAVAPLAPALAALSFMGIAEAEIAGIPVIASRSGYTGEDGFEISAPAEAAERLAEALLARPGVAPAGLGARDSLRLEAGLCLYGSDIDETTSPVEAGLTWTIGKRRRTAWDFPGAERVREELANGPRRLRVGLRPEGRQPARAHTPIHAPGSGEVLGEVTSGGFGPSLGGPMAMGYVARAQAEDGTALELLVRGRPLPARVVPTPFVPHRYAR
jgi:aminomethyltransferase